MLAHWRRGSRPLAPGQNVLFELGYVIGKLGRSNVCVLKQGEMEMLTDYVGPIYVDFDGAGAWRQTLATELQAADFTIDWNRIMGARAPAGRLSASCPRCRR
jgi:predicted nucleotide-binding protein